MYTRFSLLKEQDESTPPPLPLAKNSLKLMLARPLPPLALPGKIPPPPNFYSLPAKSQYLPTIKSRFSSYNPIKTSFSAAVTPVPFLF